MAPFMARMGCIQGGESRLRDEDEDESSRPGAVNVQLRYAATAEYYG